MAEEIQKLEDLRATIDSLDNRIHDLLMERIAVTEKVAAFKNAHTPETGKMRPGREAIILRNLIARHKGPLPVSVVVRIWREIMSAVVSLQDEMRIEVAEVGTRIPLWDLARGHFGAAQPIHMAEDAVEIIGEAASRLGLVGVLPAPDDGEVDPWWLHLYGVRDAAPKVFAKLPFIEDRGEPEAHAFCIGRVALEASGDDLTWIVLETREEISRGRIGRWLADAKLEGRVLATAIPGATRAGVYYLMEVSGFHPDDRAVSRTIRDAAGGIVTNAAHIGAFARPVRLQA